MRNKINQKQNAFEQKVDFTDKIARRLISLGGYGMILIIVFILLFLIYQSIPLYFGAKLKQLLSTSLGRGTEKILATGTDEYQEIAYTLNDNGILRFYNLDSPKKEILQIIRTDTIPLERGERILKSGKGNLQNQVFSSLTNHGRVFTGTIYFRISFEGKQRQITPEFKLSDPFIPDSASAPFIHFAFSQNENGEKYWALTTEKNQIFLHALDEDENVLFSGTLPEPFGSSDLSSLTFNQDATALICGTEHGYLIWYDLTDIEDGVLRDQWKASDGKITALSFLLGGEALIVGDDNGDVATWFSTRTPDNIMKFQNVHQFKRHPAAIDHIYPSPRNRNFITIDVRGKLHLNYSTTSKTQLGFTPAESPIQTMAITPKSDGIILVDQENRLGWFHLTNHHPEATLNSLFGKVWYESYPKPEFVWQSTGGTDEFEPKLSLIPLIFGTIKGTLYAMLFSIPLALLTAIYVSQFAPIRLARVVKPTVEIMAALPSVVIGFLAGLYFSPLFEKHLMSVLLLLFVIPTMIFLAVTFWRFIPENIRMKVPVGWELLYLLPLMIAGFWLTSLIDQTIETAFFGGDIRQWLYTIMGITYDTRNSLVVGFALGFAVIPIIFTVAEDALSNVPQSLITASMALGASRWQTVRKIVIPAASGGIFAGIMLGLGRAIGETMIVLMATGNTPIMDLSPFNGFRAMSASIAVEIPEAPVGGTLYRVLFLTALLLFIFTFILNSIAALIGDRLRKKYARF